MLVKLAWRNVFRQKRRTVFTLLTMTSGFILSSLAIGWVNGSYSGIIMYFTNNRTGQIQLHHAGYIDDPSIYSTIDNYQPLGTVLDSISGVKAWTPRIYSGALLAVRPAGAAAGSMFSNSAAATVIGIDPVMEDAATDFSNRILSGDMLTSSAADTLYSACGQIILGKELSAVLDASEGDSLVMLSQATDGAVVDRKYVIKGIISTGNANIDRNTCYVTLSDAQLLFALPDKVHEIAVMTFSLNTVDALRDDIAARLSGNGLEIDSWKVFAKEFYNGMKADEASLRVMIFIILFVAAMGVLNTILMMVLERRREFGVMKALGTKPGFIVKIVVLEANIMGLISIAAGSVLSTAGLLYFSGHGLVFDPPVNYGGAIFREMITSVSPECYWIPALCIIITASIISFLPALKAAHTSPAKALRSV